MKIIIRKARKSDASVLLELIDALAEYERLKKPTPPAHRRLIKDGFGKKKRFQTFIAFADGKAVGYAMFFETYSSFLARPTFYLEDIFVYPEYRRYGIGKTLFDQCITEARRRKCGRMEWIVLDWNKNAMKFYEKFNARKMKEWVLFRKTIS